MKNPVQTTEASAEMLLNLLYPDMKDKWIVKAKGSFFRNYSPDVLFANPEESQVNLSRDGFLKLLPQGLITLDTELKTGDFEDRYEALARRHRILQEAFIPFDSFTFRRRLDVETRVSELLNAKVDYLLLKYFHFDRSREQNPYIKAISVILPYISKLRASFGFIKDLLQSVIGCKVEMTTSRYSEKDNTRYWLPWLKYDLLVDNLTNKEYKELQGNIKALEQFLCDWFIPFDTKCNLRVKQHGQPCDLEANLTLNYNTEF